MISLFIDVVVVKSVLYVTQCDHFIYVVVVKSSDKLLNYLVFDQTSMEVKMENSRT